MCMEIVRGWRERAQLQAPFQAVASLNSWIVFSLSLNPGAFIVCWLPFFLIHILNAHCPSCHVPPGLYSASTWLGYVNSALNPIIYTTFNTDFRKAFLKILCC